MSQDFIVRGEASESDSEEQQKTDKKDVQGIVVEGEAPESDEEIEAFSTNLTQRMKHLYATDSFAFTTPHLSPEKKRKELSLLQTKLSEGNLSLWKSINNFIQTTFATASKHLILSDQTLVQSQVTLQKASHTIKEANENAAKILDKTKFILESNFLPNMNTY